MIARKKPSLKIKKLIESDSSKKNFRIVFENPELNDFINKDLIQNSFNFKESIVSSKDFRFGGCESSSVEFKVFNLPNVMNESFIVYIEYLCERDDDPWTEYKEDIDSYVFPVRLGRFVITDCKKEAANINIRKITAMTDRRMHPVMVNEINNIRNNPKPFMENRFRVDINSFLFAADQQDVHFSTSRIRDISEDDISNRQTRFRFNIGQNWYTLQVKFRVNLNQSRNSYIDDNIDFMKDLNGIYNGLDTLLPEGTNEGSILDARKYVKKFVEYMQRRVAPNTPMYYLDDEFTGIYFPPLAIVLSVTGPNYSKSGTVRFSDVPLLGLSYGFESEIESMMLEIPIPAVDEENELLEKVRKSYYELMGAFGLARYKFAPDFIQGTDSLYPENWLFPSNNLFPSGSIDAYTSNKIKKLWIDDFDVKYKAIRFKWKAHDTENVFTWKIPKNLEDLNNMEPRENLSTNTLDIIEGLVHCVFERSFITANCYLLLSTELSRGEYYIDLYRKGEKIGNLVTCSTSGGVDTYDDLVHTESNGSYSRCKVFNDALLNADEMIIGRYDGERIRSMDGIEITVLDFQDLSRNPREVEYIDEGDIYEVSDNYILDECFMDSAKIPFFVYQLDRELRKINYIPIDMEAKGLPNNEVGSQVEIQLKDRIFNTLILNRTLKGDASLQDSFDA